MSSGWTEIDMQQMHAGKSIEIYGYFADRLPEVTSFVKEASTIFIEMYNDEYLKKDLIDFADNEDENKEIENDKLKDRVSLFFEGENGIHGLICNLNRIRNAAWVLRNIIQTLENDLPLLMLLIENTDRFNFPKLARSKQFKTYIKYIEHGIGAFKKGLNPASPISPPIDSPKKNKAQSWKIKRGEPEENKKTFCDKGHSLNEILIRAGFKNGEKKRKMISISGARKFIIRNNGCFKSPTDKLTYVNSEILKQVKNIPPRKSR